MHGVCSALAERASESAEQAIERQDRPKRSACVAHFSSMFFFTTLSLKIIFNIYGMISAVRMLEQYLQCTSPPEYDAFPQKCSSSVDCFPNLCCAEGGKKHCRPPQRSLLSLLAGVGQVNYQEF